MNETLIMYLKEKIKFQIPCHNGYNISFEKKENKFFKIIYLIYLKVTIIKMHLGTPCFNNETLNNC